MDRKAVVVGVLPALMLHACDRAVAPPVDEVVAGATRTAVETPGAPAAISDPPPGYNAGAGVNEGYPDLAPAPLAPEAERTEKGARNALLAFARALELKEFDQAWAMLGPGDRQKWPKREFTRMFADLGQITVAVPAGTMEGAAGSSYYIAPIAITAPDKDGRPVRIEGEAVLRRVNDVPGATPEQLRWHFDRLALDWTH